LIALMISATGCTQKLPDLPKTFPVTGKVTMAGNKSPTGLIINFKCLASDSYNGAAKVKADGTYSASCLPRDPGLMPGEHEIWIDENIAGMVPVKYKKTETSGLKLTVKAEPNTFDISLD
jgi:hypothetical protein